MACGAACSSRGESRSVLLASWVTGRRVCELNEQNLADTTWDSEAVSHSDVKLFMMLVRAAEQWVSEFNAQHLANMVWVFAKTNHLDEKLFAALSRGGFVSPIRRTLPTRRWRLRRRPSRMCNCLGNWRGRRSSV